MFKPAAFVCLSQANVICHCPFSVFSELRWKVIVCFVDIGGIVDYPCLNFLLLKVYFG